MIIEFITNAYKIDFVSSTDASPGPDEQYCHECGEIIKEAAEICPECGVRQQVRGSQDHQAQSGGGGGDSYEQQRIRGLKNKARSGLTTVGLLGFFISPAAYVVVGEWKWVLINLVTLNYFLLGFLIVPFHARGMVKDARAELDGMGESW